MRCLSWSESTPLLDDGRCKLVCLDHSCRKNCFTVQIGGGAPILLNGYINLCGRADNAQARLFDGKLAHLALFNRFLTATQIRNLYQAYTSNSTSAAPGRPP